jgi:hypothetical protein
LHLVSATMGRLDTFRLDLMCITRLWERARVRASRPVAVSGTPGAR